MKNEDVCLINRVLEGDESAFTELVHKYQKSVHALAWRKVDDFHIAEELAQDAFLKAYEKLSTLKNPNQFAGWIYVITDRLCIAWHRKQKPQMESLETTSREDIDESSYRCFEDERLKEASVEFRHSLIKNLLEELPESERTVVTLHYLGEMKCKAIGEFLGVSVNTVKSRLQRARNRLQEHENVIRETLRGVQLSVNFTENIIRQVAEIKPVVPTSSKPIVPWAAAVATALFIFLLIGVGSQYLVRFQRPYNINADSETTVELINAPIVLNTQAKPDLRNQSGRFNAASTGRGSQVSESVALATAQLEQETLPSTKQQWVQTSGPEGGLVSGLLRSTKGDIYAVLSGSIYRFAPSTPIWSLINRSVLNVNSANSKDYNLTPITEHNDTLYLVSIDEVLASTDRGESWTSLGSRPKGNAIALAITDDAFYLILENGGVFRSMDIGKHWTLLNDETSGMRIHAVAALENTVFVGTTEGLYRISSGTWEKLPIDTTKAIHSLAASENNLYVGTGLNFFDLETPEGKAAYMRQLTSRDNSSAWEVFHSTDMGNSWTEITPINNSFIIKVSPNIKIVASGKTVLALGGTGFRFRSTDRGKTWTEFGVNTFDIKSMMNSMMLGIFPAVAVDENTFLQAGALGMTRSNDGGETWQPFMKGMIGTSILNIVAFKNVLYANTGSGIVKSIDSGKLWKIVQMSNESILTPPGKTIPSDLLFFPRLATSGNVLYGITSTLRTENALSIFCLSENSNTLVPIQETPAFGRNLPIEVSATESQKVSKDNTADAPSTIGGFAVSRETFYVEYKRQLFRWKRGKSEWFNTGLIDTSGSSDNSDNTIKGFKLAVSEETVYVGKRDGHLFQSFDGGSTWKNLTSSLPLRFERFNDIVFADSKVYVATNAGVLTSAEGEHWHLITDKAGIHTIIDRMAVADTTVCGIGKDGAYRLDKRNNWQNILPAVPNNIIAVAINSDRLYISTQEHGLFYALLE